ncbi:MAG: hypothetical protein HC881_11140 [Leptolyngbyaceae cyanobacterium SL_7_1]|nr:hypothetical protein [Leptolyngbyaceae cyanobacterium SL_7_1]
MNWTVGQRVVCDRPEQLLTDCIVQQSEAGSVVISCPFANIVVSGTQERLEQLGWRMEEPQLQRRVAWESERWREA